MAVSPRTSQSRTFSTIEACKLAGLTPRLADEWIARGVIAPSESEAAPGSGSYRRWSESDVRILTVLRRLNDTRASYPARAVAAKVLARTPPRVHDPRWLVVSEKAGWVVSLRELPISVGDGCWVVKLG